jgi:hypothetical protein
MFKCEHFVADGDPRVIGPCGRPAITQCADCQEPLCLQHIHYIDTVQLCRLCYFIRSRENDTRDLRAAVPRPS